MPDQRPNRINVLLDDEHAAKLYAIAERTYLQPGAVARSLLSIALDQANPDGVTITAILDSIPGAWESVRRGEADYAAGRVVPHEEPLSHAPRRGHGRGEARAGHPHRLPPPTE